MQLDSILARKTAPPKAPDNFEIKLADDDDWENPDSSLSDEAIDGLTFGIEYCNAKNEHSRRRITLKNRNNYYLYAFCHERHATRCFAIDRVQSIILLQTGEVIENVKAFIDTLDVAQKTQTSHERKSKYGPKAEDKPETDRAMGRVRDGARILMWFARCDGEVPSEEIEAIMEHYCYSRCEETEGRTALAKYDKDYMRRYVSLQYPDSQTLKACIDRIVNSDSEDHIALLKTAIQKVIDADGRLTAEEVEASLYFGEIFSEAGQAQQQTIWQKLGL